MKNVILYENENNSFNALSMRLYIHIYSPQFIISVEMAFENYYYIFCIVILQLLINHCFDNDRG